MVHVLDVAFSMARAAGCRNIPSGTYILSNENYRVIDIANTIKEIIDCEVNITEMKFEDQRNYKVNNTKAKSVGLFCSTTLLDGILYMYSVMGSGRIANIWAPAFHNEKYLRNNQ
jgi:nucleoside-diphosphate-sugar epimerase